MNSIDFVEQLHNGMDPAYPKPPLRASQIQQDAT